MPPLPAREITSFPEAVSPLAPSPFGLIESILFTTTPTSTSRAEPERLSSFLNAYTVRQALNSWLGDTPKVDTTEEQQRLVRTLNAAVARIDDLLNAQLNAVLHHADFQKLEAAWRGLNYLVEQVPDGSQVKVRVLNVSWRDLVKDQERALEFDQSQLFRKIYNDEFGMPGGEPFGLLLGNYDICHRPFPDHPTDDLAALRGIMQTAAASFAPFLAGVDPRFFELDSYSELEPTIDLARAFEQSDYTKWRSLRNEEDARFLGLIVPRVVLREPYSDATEQQLSFPFQEDTTASTNSGYLWGNGCFAFGAVAVRTFAESSWLAEVRGVRAGESRGGIVQGLPAIETGTGYSVSRKAITDLQLTDRQEKEISELGFVPLCHLPETSEAAFYTLPSVQKAKIYDDDAATANARLSCMLQYMLCVSRIAHYLKVIVRDRVGSFITPQDCEESLRQWVQQYIVSNDSASAEMKARYPLREARVEVKESSGQPGVYRCTMFLRPHFQLDQLSAGIKLATQLSNRTE